MANRLKCRSSSGDGRTPRPAATRAAMVPSPGGAIRGTSGLSVALTGCLPDGWRHGELLGHDSAEGAQDSLSGFCGPRQPELARGLRTGSTDRARGGTGMVGDRRMMTLLVDSSGDGSGTTRPAREVPKTRL